MPNSRPSLSDLLDGVMSYLQEDLLPNQESRHKYLLRVALNVLGIVQREITLGPELDDAERHRLAALLGHAGRLDALQRELTDLISAGGFPLDDATLLNHLKQATAESLAVNNPKWTKDIGKSE